MRLEEGNLLNIKPALLFADEIDASGFGTLVFEEDSMLLMIEGFIGRYKNAAIVLSEAGSVLFKGDTISSYRLKAGIEGGSIVIDSFFSDPGIVSFSAKAEGIDITYLLNDLGYDIPLSGKASLGIDFSMRILLSGQNPRLG
jgi:hypothetical protein